MPSALRPLLGLFEVGPGTRALTNFSFSGSLEGKEHSVAAESIKKGQTQSSTNRILLPVGNYRPNYLSVKYGNLGIDMSENYHSDGHRQNRQGRQPVYGFEIRKDRPYFLDFSNKPEVHVRVTLG